VLEGEKRRPEEWVEGLEREGQEGQEGQEGEQELAGLGLWVMGYGLWPITNGSWGWGRLK
jgi:hypothetical protein